MKPAPLQLERHFFTKIHLDAHRDGDPETPVEVRSEVDVACDAQDHKRYELTLRLRLLSSTEKKPHYTAEIHVVGLVRVAETWSEDKVLQLVEANAPALLYGAAREMVCNLTARGPWPMLCLHSVTFGQPKPPSSSQHSSIEKTKPAKS